MLARFQVTVTLITTLAIAGAAALTFLGLDEDFLPVPHEILLSASTATTTLVLLLAVSPRLNPIDPRLYAGADRSVIEMLFGQPAPACAWWIATIHAATLLVWNMAAPERLGPVTVTMALLGGLVGLAALLLTFNEFVRTRIALGE